MKTSIGIHAHASASLPQRRSLAQRRSLVKCAFIACMVMIAHQTSAIAQDTMRDSASHPLVSDTLVRFTRTVDSTDAEEREVTMPSETQQFRIGTRVVRKDSTALLPYVHAGDLLAFPAGMFWRDGGTIGSAGWLGMQGAPPHLTSAARDGATIDDITSGRPDLLILPTEDCAALLVHPAHLAFYHGAPGALTAVETISPMHDTPHPYTRIRHTEAPDDYLFTDVLFTMNPGAHDNIHLGLTRQTLGSASTGNIARFPNARHEAWDVRAGYRIDVSGALRLELADTYDDNLTFMNGGALAWRNDPSSPWLTFPTSTASAFSDTAFNPLLAAFVNPTMDVRAHRNELTGSATLKWDSAGMQRTRVHITHVVRSRTFSDHLDRNLPAGYERPRLVNEDRWNDASLALTHASTLGWAELELRGRIERHDIEVADISHTTGINSTLSGMLTTQTGPVQLEAAARIDHSFGAAAAGLGGSARVMLAEGMGVWAGASASDRAPTLLERSLAGDRVTDIGARTTANDRTVIAEGGFTLAQGALSADFRAFGAQMQLQRRISVGVAPDTLPSGYVRMTTVFDNTPVTWRTAGASLDLRLLLWNFEIETHAALSAPASGAPVFSPRYAAASSLAWRGALIEGTLDLRAGASWTAASAFDPARYNPERDLFGIPARGVDDGARSYTNSGRLDLFLFATIKRSATIHLILFNALDARSITTSFLPMPEMGLRFGVDWIFLD